jgi:hypothetical protein
MYKCMDTVSFLSTNPFSAFYSHHTYFEERREGKKKRNDEHYITPGS